MRCEFCAVTAAALLLTNINAAAAPIVFGDEGIELLVRAAIDQAEGDIDDADPRLADILELTSGPLLIDSLAGIEFLVNLESLSLPGNRVTDLAPLSGLVALRDLNLANNQVADLGPLSGLDELESLDLTENLVTNLEPLADLRGLVTLRLGGNMIANIGPLANLTGPAVLELNDNVIRDAGPLLSIDAFPAGADVDLRGNPLSNDSLCSVVLPLQRDGVNVLSDGECPGIIVGTIRDEFTEQPIVCALVIAEPPLGSPSIGVTGLDGSYQLDGLPPGVVNSLRIFAPGYRPEVGQGSVQSSSERRISFFLARQSISGFLVVDGTVTDAESDAALAGVQIEATSGQSRRGETFSCGDGLYQLLLNTDDRDATVTYSALGYQSISFDLANGTPGNIALVPNSIRGGSVSGRVFDGRSRTVVGLAGARVTVKAEGGAIAYSTRADDHGDYAITNLPFDVYTVRVTSSRIADEFAQRSVDVDGAIDELEFTLGTFVDEGDSDPQGCPDNSSALLAPQWPATEWIVYALAAGLIVVSLRKRKSSAVF